VRDYWWGTGPIKVNGIGLLLYAEFKPIDEYIFFADDTRVNK